MELRAYWAILRRRIWLVLLTTLIALLYVGYSLLASRGAVASTTYTSTVGITMEVAAPDRNAPAGATPSYNDRLSIADTLAESFQNGPVLTSSSFAKQISAQISSDMPTIEQRFGQNPALGSWRDAKTISSALAATRSHAQVTVKVNWSTSAGAWAIATAVGEIVPRNIGTYVNFLMVTPATGQGAQLISARVVSPADDPIVTPGGAPATKKTTLLLVVLVAIVLGIALAFLADYVDDRVRGKEEIADLLHLPVIGEVPAAHQSGQGQTRTFSRPAAPVASK